MSRGLHRVHACMSLMRTDFTRPHQKLFTVLWSSPSHLHSKSTTGRKWQPSILHHWDFFFIFLPSPLFLSLLHFLSFSVLAIWQLILTSAVRPNVPALSSSSSSTPSSSSPRFPSTQVSLIMSDHMIKTSVLLTLKGQFTQKWYFVIIDPPSPWTTLLPYNEKREVEQSLYTIKSNGDWWGSKKNICYYYLLKIILCSQIFWRLCKNIADKSYELFIVFLCFFIHYKNMERAALIFC